MPSRSFTRSSTTIAMSSAERRLSLAEAGRAVEHAHRERLGALLAVGDAELEAAARLDDRARGQRGGVQEHLLAVVGGDEAEALLLVVELDLAGRHARPLSSAPGDRALRWPYCCPVAENAPVPLNRTERSLAVMIAAIVGSRSSRSSPSSSPGAPARATGEGVWPPCSCCSLIGLPIALVLMIVFVIVSIIRRRRLARDAGR